MSRRIRVRPGAERDIETAFAWYEEQRTGLGRQFLDELDVVYLRIAKSPFIYAELYRGLRRARLRRFPVGVFYLVSELEVRIVAVIHRARSPRVWQSRG